MEKMDLIVAEMRRQLETMEEGIEEPRSGGDGAHEEMQMVSDSTVDIVHENMKDEARGELKRPTQRRTFKEIVANLRDKKKLPWKWECYFCEGEHWSSECPQRLARIQKPENEKEWEDSDSGSDLEKEEEEEDEIGPTQVSTEDRGSEPHLDIIKRKEDGPTTEGIVPKETENEKGLIAGGAVPRESQLILVEDQDSLHDELPSRREEKEDLTMEKVVPKEIPSVLEEFRDGTPTQMDSLELVKRQKEPNDSCWRMYSKASVVVQEGSNHCRPESFKKTRLQKSERSKERKKTLLQLRNFHEEKT